MQEKATGIQQSGLSSRIDFDSDADPVGGEVKWDAPKSVWWTLMTLGWLSVGIYHFSLSSVFVFLVLCGVTLCFGHSLGMHRKLIHESYQCPSWLERMMIYLSTLVGLGGPFTMMYNHDMRDWAQRSSACHAYLAHQRPIVTDFWWQIHCKLYLDRSPDFTYPAHVKDVGFYHFLQKNSMLQQLPIAVILYLLGGWGWVAWGVCGRVSISIFGHWLVGYFAHNSGQRDWHLENASVQGFNVPHLGLITFGECWHNNHHAFPQSARLGLRKDQLDPGWMVLSLLQKYKLVWDVQTPENLAKRAHLAFVGKGEQVVS